MAGGEVGSVVVEAIVNSIGGGFRPHGETIGAHVYAGEDAVFVGWDGVGAAGEGECPHSGHISQAGYTTVSIVVWVAHVAVESIASGVVEANVDVFAVGNNEVIRVEGGVGLTLIKS